MPNYKRYGLKRLKEIQALHKSLERDTRSLDAYIQRREARKAKRGKK
ncbi:MAG: hypothetical protein HY558_06580 [Euryarchaeota archaeon]|nr:hypothetical protein [Euryarchaeota archaeon]